MKNVGSNNERTLPETIIREVKAAATQGATQVLGLCSQDLIEEVVAEVNLRLVRVWPTNPPHSPANWAFQVAKNLAKRLGKKASDQKKHEVELADHLEVLAGGPDLDLTTEPIGVEEGLEALDRLIEITNRTIHDVGSDIDRRIFVLLHVRGSSFEEIAAAVGLSTTAVHRRYYRLITQVTGLVRQRVQGDSRLNRIFLSVLHDEQIFRCTLLGLLNVIARKGFSGIRQILESFLS